VTGSGRLPHIEEHSSHEYFGDDGLEYCPGCGTCLTPRHHDGPVYEPLGPQTAREYDGLYDTDPSDRPFYCAECWREHVKRVKQAVNRQLSDYATTTQTYYGE